ncbi:kinase-like domain-containing protein [Chaetomium tenue]|uniref:Kinase-like domain-containing protein n=1 Tax=Chaetomium tenue TaxID=1854479 RepID=A0ACB7P9J3_9PEZI|nr:kinase-like domain-containing protein [Chaetomium globosum]
MDEEQDSEDVAFEHLKKYVDNLGPDVTLIHVGLDGNLISLSSDPVHDNTPSMYYPPSDLVERPAGVQVILRSELRELDRFIGNVDLVSYQAESDDREASVTKTAVFKYYWNIQFVGKIWDEMNLWLRLSHHPNIVPIDRLVLDEVRGGVVGFTTIFIPGGTLEDNVSRTFKLKWCKQLMALVDDLNLRYGIAHQDIVPRNLLVDESTDNIMLFDFDWSAQIGRRRGPLFLSYWDIRDDVRAVVFTIYEMITRDFHFREEDWEKLDVSLIQDIEWVQHPDITLDHPVAEYRALLNAWLKTRAEGKQVTVYTDAPEYIDWPILEIPTGEFTISTGADRTVETWTPMNLSKALAQGKKLVEWRRPKQNTLKGDYHLLATGKLLD